MKLMQGPTCRAGRALYGIARWRALSYSALTAVTVGLLLGSPQPAHAFKVAGHVALAMEVRDSLPQASRIRAAMESRFECAAWGANAPDLPGNSISIAAERTPWFDAYHYLSNGAYAKELMRRALASNDDRQIAFAAGWVTHIVGDLSVHGELVNIESGTYVDTGSEDRDHHSDLESWADAVSWSDPDMGDHDPQDYNHRTADPGDRENTKLYNYFVNAAGLPTLPSDRSIESLVDETNRSVILSRYGNLSYLTGTATYDVVLPTSVYPYFVRLYQNGDYFGKDNMRAAENISVKIISWDDEEFDARRLEGDPVAALVAWIRNKKVKLYQPLKDSQDAMEQNGTYWGTTTRIPEKRIVRLKRAWGNAKEDAVILLKNAAEGEYGQFSNQWVADRGIDGRTIGSLNVFVKTGFGWKGTPLDVSGTNRNVYFGMEFADGVRHEWRLDHAGYDDHEAGDWDVYYLKPFGDYDAYQVKKIWVRVGTDPFSLTDHWWNMATFMVQINDRFVYSAYEWDHWTKTGTSRETGWQESNSNLNPMVKSGWPIGPLGAMKRPVGEDLRRELKSSSFEGSVPLDGWRFSTAGTGFTPHMAWPTSFLELWAVTATSQSAKTQAYQELLVTPGERYRLSVLTNPHLDPAEDRLRLVFRDSGGNAVEERAISAAQSGIKAGEVRTMYLDGVVPARAAKARVILEVETGSSWQTGSDFDDVEWAREGPQNAGFEGWSGGSGSLDAWTPRNSALFSRLVGWTSRRESDACLKLDLSKNPLNANGTLISRDTASIRQAVMVTPGKLYEASVDAAPKHPGQVSLMMQFRDARGLPAGTPQLTTGADAGATYAAPRSLTVTATAPASATHATVIITGSLAGSNISETTALFDDFRFTGAWATRTELKGDTSNASYGSALALTITVQKALGQEPVPSALVAIERQTTSGWVVDQTYAITGGTRTVSYQPRSGGTIRARLLGDGEYGESVSSLLTFDLTRVASKITLFAAPLTQRAGHTATITVAGTAVGGETGLPVTGSKVTLERYTTRWETVAQLTLGQNGLAETTVSVDVRRRYRAQFAGDDRFAASTSAVLEVGPRYTLSLRVPTAVSKQTRAVSYDWKGSQSPAIADSCHTVVLRCYHYESGRWVRRASVETTGAGGSATSSLYTARLALSRTGKWRVQAYAAADAAHKAMASGWKYVTVK